MKIYAKTTNYHTGSDEKCPMHLSTNILAGMQEEVHKFSEDQP